MEKAVPKDAPNDPQSTVLQAKDPNTDGATIAPVAPSPPTSPRRKDSSIERIEVEGSFKYNAQELAWSFEGQWVFKDPSEEHEALAFSYRFPCADQAKATTQTDTKENAVFQLPEKSSWVSSVSMLGGRIL